MAEIEEPKLKEVDNSLPGQTSEPERPFVKPFPGGIRLTWRYTDLEITADLTHITDKATAEVTFFYSMPGSDRETLLLATNRIDFLSSTQKYNLSRQLHDIGYVGDCDSLVFNWERKVNDLALAVLQNCRPNEPAIEIRLSPELILTPEYVVAPILYRNLTNIIFGDYGSLKSLTAMVLAYIAQLPHPNNKLGLMPGRKTSTRCLWLDYEGQSENFAKQWTAIQRGFMPDIAESARSRGIESPDDLELIIVYKPMQMPLADSIEVIKQEMSNYQIEMLIIDSLGPAAGGNLNDPEPAIRYHRALRMLGETSLTLAHNSKDPMTDSKSIFGSVFFSNLARSIWQCKAEKEAAADYAIVSLKQIKASLSQLHLPLGFTFTFDNTSSIISVEKTDLKGTSLAGDLPLSIRIRNELRRGPMSVRDIADALDAKDDSIKTILNRMAKPGKEITIKQGELWALRQKE